VYKCILACVYCVYAHVYAYIYFFVPYVVGCVWQPLINEHDDDDDDGLEVTHDRCMNAFKSVRVLAANLLPPTYLHGVGCAGELSLCGLEWVSRGLTSHSTVYRSFRGQFLQDRWPNQQRQSTVGSQLAAEIGFNPTRTTPLCYNMNCRQPPLG